MIPYAIMWVADAILGVALCCAFVRLRLGPTLPDRIAAMELISVITVCIIVATAAITGEPSFLDPAFVIGLVGFLGTVAYVWYVHRTQGDR
jgi:multicomponent Na+:H+ antiporter subunit F